MEVKVICILLNMFICSSRSCKACSHFCNWIMLKFLVAKLWLYCFLSFFSPGQYPFFLAAKVVQLTDLNSVVFSLCLGTPIAESQIYWPILPAQKNHSPTVLIAQHLLCHSVTVLKPVQASLHRCSSWEELKVQLLVVFLFSFFFWRSSHTLEGMKQQGKEQFLPVFVTLGYDISPLICACLLLCYQISLHNKGI